MIYRNLIHRQMFADVIDLKLPSLCFFASKDFFWLVEKNMSRFSFFVLKKRVCILYSADEVIILVIPPVIICAY